MSVMAKSKGGKGTQATSLEGSRLDDGVPPIGHGLNELSNVILRSAIRAYPAVAGVKVVEAWVIRQVGHRKVISAREIAKAISADEGQVSRAIRSLLDKKLVVRAQDPSYSRRKLIKLTSKGERVFRIVNEVYRSRVDKLIEGISEKEQKQFFETMLRVRANADQLLDDSKIEN